MKLEHGEGRHSRARGQSHAEPRRGLCPTVHLTKLLFNLLRLCPKEGHDQLLEATEGTPVSVLKNLEKCKNHNHCLWICLDTNAGGRGPESSVPCFRKKRRGVCQGAGPVLTAARCSLVPQLLPHAFPSVAGRVL